MLNPVRAPGAWSPGQPGRCFLLSIPNYFRKPSNPTRSDTRFVRRPYRQHRLVALLDMLTWMQPHHLSRFELQMADQDRFSGVVLLVDGESKLRGLANLRFLGAWKLGVAD